MVARRSVPWIQLIAASRHVTLTRLAWVCSAIKQLQSEEDPVLREALRVQMMEFGRTPRQLFRKPHPKRRVRLAGCSFHKTALPAHPCRGLL